MAKFNPVKSLITVIIAFIIFLVIGFALVTPNGYKRNEQIPNESPVKTLSSSQIELSHDCVRKGELMTPTGEDAYIVFNVKSYGFRTAGIFFDSPKNQGLTIYYDTGSGFFEEQTYRLETDNSKPIYLYFEDTKVDKIRIDFVNKISVKNINLYESSNVSYEKIVISKAWYALATVVALLLAVICAAFEKKYDLISYVRAALSRKRYRIICFAAVTVLLGFASYLIEILIGNVLLDAYFSKYRFLFIFSCFMLVFEFIFFSKTAAKNPEFLYLATVLTIGISIAIISPIGHTSWDIETHYFISLKSTGKTVYMTKADQFITFAENSFFPSDDAYENLHRIGIYNAYDYISLHLVPFEFSLPHFFAGAALRVGKFLNFPFEYAYALGKLANLFIYSIVTFFAIRKLKTGKMILTVIALFPTAIFLAANYAYDFWVTGFIMLGFAYFFSEMQQPNKKIKFKDTVIMCGAFAFALLPKSIYFPIMLVPFFMKRKKIWNKKKYYGICFAAIVFVIIVLIVEFFGNVSTGGDVRGGADVNTSRQIGFILSNPLEYTKILLKFLSEYLSIPTMKQYITHFANMGMGIMFYIPVALLMITAATDKNDFDKYTSKVWLKLIIGLLCFGCACLVATALYIAFTPVGLDTINGCQPRYILPLIFPIAAVMGSCKLKLPLNRKVYNTAIVIICAAISMINVYRVFLLKMIVR